MNIETVHICPPIPIRTYDWCAFDADTYDEEGGDIRGWGATREEAIADLLRQIEEANDDGA
jgi:hypothetical protein